MIILIYSVRTQTAGARKKPGQNKKTHAEKLLAWIPIGSQRLEIQFVEEKSANF